MVVSLFGVNVFAIDVPQPPVKDSKADEPAWRTIKGKQVTLEAADSYYKVKKEQLKLKKIENIKKINNE